MPVSPNNAFDRLYRAMRPLDPSNQDGGWQLVIAGSVNLAGGGGAGGTSMVDNNPFTPGGTSITPAGGYFGGRQVASGNAAAPALSASAILQVHVVAGGAGGGLSQLQIVGSDNSSFVNVGYPSGGSPTYNSIPVQVMNAAAIGGGAGGGFASVAVYGSPAMPVYAVGSVNVVNVIQVTAVGASMNFVGSVNPHGIFAPAGSVNVYGSVNIAGPIDAANSAVRVNVVTGGAGGGNANLTVRGSGNADIHVGYASGAAFNQDGGAYVPILGTVNLGAGAAPFASVAVYGSPGMPVYVIGSVNVVNQAANSGFASVAVYGSPAMPVYVVGSVNVVNGLTGSVAATNLGGSVGVTQIGAPWSFVGSVGVTPLAAFSLGGVAQVDPRGSLVPTQWIISVGGSGQFAIAGSAPANQRNYFTGYRFISTGTVDVQFESPSGVAVSGSLRILPGAGIVDSGGGNWPVLVGSQQSAIYMRFTGTQNVGGWANGYIAP